MQKILLLLLLLLLLIVVVVVAAAAAAVVYLHEKVILKLIKDNLNNIIRGKFRKSSILIN